MDERVLANVCKQVYQRFPEVKGVRPKTRVQPNDTTLLIFQANPLTANGHALPTSVRVTVGADGRIIKMSSSR